MHIGKQFVLGCGSRIRISWPWLLCFPPDIAWKPTPSLYHLRERVSHEGTRKNKTKHVIYCKLCLPGSSVYKRCHVRRLTYARLGASWRRQPAIHFRGPTPGHVEEPERRHISMHMERTELGATSIEHARARALTSDIDNFVHSRWLVRGHRTPSRTSLSRLAPISGTRRRFALYTYRRTA